jgi:hypothetical protein
MISFMEDVASQCKIAPDFLTLSSIMSKKQNGYVSDFTKFLTDMKQKDPKIEENQRIGRSIWWDKAPIDLDARRRAEESRIEQQAYVYQPKH